MDSVQRQEIIITMLKESGKTINATFLSEHLQVSRQAIVSDIALLRAKGYDVVSTPRGYTINTASHAGETIFKVACLHDSGSAKDEIYAIVDNGGKLVDVIVEHPIYGQLVGQLNISSRYEADDFLEKVKNGGAYLLSKLTEGIHLHTISCKDKKIKERIIEILSEKKILLTPFDI